MSITKELREWVKDSLCVSLSIREVRENLLAIADRIDAEHKKAIASVMNDALYHANEKDMAELGWVRLPKDADGEPWRLGDELMVEGEVCEVVGIGGKTIFYAFGDGIEWTIAHNNHHHHAPTVEDVLRDMHMELDEVTALYVGEAIDSDERDRDEARIFAKYAAKLRLADDGEEQ